MIGNLAKLGFFEFFLPFVLFMAIFYGVLHKSKVISEEVSVNGVIAVAMAFFVVNYTPIGLYATTIFFWGATIITGLLLIVMFAGVLGVSLPEFFKINESGDKGPAKYVVAIAGLLGAGILLLLISQVTGIRIDTSFFSSDTFLTLVMLLGLIGFAYVLMRGS